ncbi:MAG: glycosyltransferase [Bacteroidota bacterium]
MSRIALITPAYPLRGGIATFGERLASVLQDMGHEVKIYTFSLQYPNFLFPGKTQYSEDPAPVHLDIEVSINSVNPLNWWQVGNRICRTNYDRAICVFWLPFMGPSLGTILRQVRKNKQTHIVGLIHNIVPHEKRPGDRLFAQYFTDQVDAFVTLSDAVAAQIKNFAPQKSVAVSPHPIYDHYGKLETPESAKAHLHLNPRQPYLLFFGFIRAYKGLDILLNAMSDERIRQLGVKLIIAGEFYGDEAPYQEQIDQLGIRDLLELHTHFISNEEVRYYFSAADLVVQPYKTATQSGISQIAYHFNRPMIVTNVGGLGEIVTDGKSGYVVPVDATAIADAIVDFYRHDRSDQLKIGVQQEKQRFSWKTLAAAILSA